MKPLNQKERSNLYWQFLAFYILSIVVVIIAVSFYFNSGNVTANQIKKSKDELNDFKATLAKGTVKIYRVDSLISIMDQNVELNSEQKAEITDAMKELKKMESGIGALDSLYEKIGGRYFNVYDNKVSLKQSGQSVEVVKKLNDDLSKAKEDLSKMQSAFDMYKTMHPN